LGARLDTREVPGPALQSRSLAVLRHAHVAGGQVCGGVPALPDVNGDGKPDLVVCTSAVSVLINTWR
jgi:hypothetical protein